MLHQQTIVVLFDKGWSKPKFARELALDRAAVLKRLEGVGSNSPTPQTGSATDEHGDKTNNQRDLH